MKANTIRVLEQCIDNGLSYGWQRAHKHTDNPSKETIMVMQGEEIINEIYEWFVMGDDDATDRMG
jgi:hypothetical protein